MTSRVRMRSQQFYTWIANGWVALKSGHIVFGHSVQIPLTTWAFAVQTEDHHLSTGFRIPTVKWNVVCFKLAECSRQLVNWLGVHLLRDHGSALLWQGRQLWQVVHHHQTERRKTKSFWIFRRWRVGKKSFSSESRSSSIFGSNYWRTSHSSKKLVWLLFTRNNFGKIKQQNKTKVTLTAARKVFWLTPKVTIWQLK